MNANNISIWNICSILLDRHRRRVKRFDDGLGGRNHPVENLSGDVGFRPEMRSRVRGADRLPSQGRLYRILGKGINLDRGLETAQQPGTEIFQLSPVSGHADEFLGEKNGASCFLRQRFKPRGDIDGRADDGEIEAGFGADIAIHDIPDMHADAITQRIMALLPVDLVKRNEARLGAGNGLQQIFRPSDR